MLENNSPERFEPFNDTPQTIDLSPQERFLSVTTMRHFRDKMQRSPLWNIKHDKVTKPGQLLITGEDLSKETISPELASVLFTFKRVEDKLPDFMQSSNNIFRNIQGIHRSYQQWGIEEGQHSDAAGLVLTATGHKTEQDIEDDYQENLKRTWAQSFPTGRQMVIYASFQEVVTSLAYHALEEQAKKEGAFNVAKIMQLIAQDEAWHGSGYKAFTKIYAQVDPEETAKDVLHIAANFRMPAQNLMLDPVKETLSSARVGAFRKKKTADAISSVLKGYSNFVSEDRANEAVKQFLKR